MNTGTVWRLGMRLVVWGLVATAVAGTLWREELFDFYERGRIIKLGDDFHALETRQAPLQEFQGVLADRWKPAIVSLKEGKLAWNMEILEYREREQGHYFIVFEAESGRLIGVRRWPRE